MEIVLRGDIHFHENEKAQKLRRKKSLGEE